MADTVLFDLFGVIARQQSSSGQELLVATAGVSAPVFWETYWALRIPYDRGEATGSEYWRQVAAALGTTFDDHQIALRRGRLLLPRCAGKDASSLGQGCCRP
jgi:putative hydrolase of the HAD superfamily